MAIGIHEVIVMNAYMFDMQILHTLFVQSILNITTGLLDSF